MSGDGEYVGKLAAYRTENLRAGDKWRYDLLDGNNHINNIVRHPSLNRLIVSFTDASRPSVVLEDVTYDNWMPDEMTRLKVEILA